LQILRALVVALADGVDAADVVAVAARGAVERDVAVGVAVAVGERAGLDVGDGRAGGARARLGRRAAALDGGRGDRAGAADVEPGRAQATDAIHAGLAGVGLDARVAGRFERLAGAGLVAVEPVFARRRVGAADVVLLHAR